MILVRLLETVLFRFFFIIIKVLRLRLLIYSIRHRETKRLNVHFRFSPLREKIYLRQFRKVDAGNLCKVLLTNIFKNKIKLR